jgi:hypothetical protein
VPQRQDDGPQSIPNGLQIRHETIQWPLIHFGRSEQSI